ncbi:MAG: patatin family protein [Eubacteriales bacterium]|nr:patatin family protein [Eubacteriales bacterium]
MYNAGLILEGGGMRGVYTAGVLDAFLENDVEFSSVYGVSAGSCQACSYLTKQKGRGVRTVVNYVNDPEYCSVKSLVKTGDMFGVDFCYSKIPYVLDPVDSAAFQDYKGKFYAVLTNLETGEAEYIRVKDMEKQIWAVRASSSLPLLSRTIIAKGRPFLDGGVADPIPLKRSIATGNKKNVVILTRDASYRKESNPLVPIMKLRYKKYPNFVDRMADRHIRYNETLDYLNDLEEKGEVFVIRPQYPVEVDRLEKDKDKLMVLYNQGLEEGRAAIAAMREYLEK